MGDSNKNSKFASAINEVLRWSNLDPMERVSVLEGFRQVWRRSVIDSYGHQPEKMEEFFQQGDAAFQQLSKVLKLLNLPTPDVNRLLKEAEKAFKEKDFQKSVDFFQVAEKYKVLKDTDHWISFGTAHFHIGNLDEVQRCAEEALKLAAENVKAMVLIGLVALGRKQFTKAKEIFEHAKKLRPDSSTIIRYLEATDSKIKYAIRELPLADVEVSGPKADPRKTNPAAKRRWVRRPCNYQMTVNDFDQMTALSARVRSLSAGGCLIDDSPIPETFSFSLDLGNGKSIQGTGKRIYTNPRNQIGIVFEALNPQDQDLIQRKLMV